MITDLYNALVSFNRLEDQIQGMISYYDKHASRMTTLAESVANYLDKGQFTDSLSDDQAIILGSATESTEQVLCTVGEMKTALGSFINSDSLAETIDVPCYVDSTQVNLKLNEVLERMSEAVGVGLGFMSTLQGLVDGMRNNSSDLINEVRDRLSNLSIGDQAKTAIMSGLINVRTAVGSLAGCDVRTALPAILGLFGATNAKDECVTATVATYSGINALTAILSDFVGDITDALSKLPTVIVNAVGFIFYGLYQLGAYAFEKIGNYIATRINEYAGYTDALRPTDISNGDGTLAIDYSYTYEYSTGSWQLQYIQNALATMGGSSITGIIPTGALLIQDDPDNSCVRLSFLPRRVNTGRVAVVMASTFARQPSDWMPWSLKSSDVLKHNNISTWDYSLSLEGAIKFLNDIFMSEDIYYVDPLATDAQAATDVMCAQFLTSLLCSLYSYALTNDTWVNSAFSTIVNKAISAMPNGALRNPWNSYAYDDVTVTNRWMGVIASSMQPSSFGFSGGSLLNPGLTNTVSVDLTDSGGLIDSVAELMHYVWATGDITNNDAMFLPYRKGIYSNRPSWFIPSDQQNYEATRAMLKSGLIKLTAVVVAVTAFYVYRKVKFSLFNLHSKADSMAWAAAEAGDSAKMATAFKLKKRANLLEKIFGFGVGSASSAVSISSDSTLITNVGKLIKTSF